MIDEKVICLMPWIHTHIWPNGNAFPCCMSDSNVVFGNVHNEPINELMNNNNYKTLRKQMIAGEKPSVCSRCYELETSADSWTLRKNSLISFKNHRHLIDETNKDGSINDFKMRYLDIRFSNLCNMKCRTCGPDLSSSWYDDQIKIFPRHSIPKFIDLNSKPNFMDELKPHLDTIEEVYFAGGESLITPQHYEILDYWLETGRTNVKLRYTTNFSVLKFKDKSILEYWKKFEDVRVAASLDTFKEKAEYSRKGTIWKLIESNRKKMLEKCPNIYFEITPTVSIFSVHSLFEFHKSWVEMGLLNVDNIRINILTHPRYFSITILPKEYKDIIKDTYVEYVAWLNSVKAQPDIIHAVQGIISYMYSADHTELLPRFKKEIATIDNIRNERFSDIFPEMKLL
jgi:radical SAM protein with 4Fe4S-binding SPASM domain